MIPNTWELDFDAMVTNFDMDEIMKSFDMLPRDDSQVGVSADSHSVTTDGISPFSGTFFQGMNAPALDPVFGLDSAFM